MDVGMVRISDCSDFGVFVSSKAKQKFADYMLRTVSSLDSIRHEVTVNHQVFKVRNFVYQNSKLVDARHVRLNDETTVVLLPPGQPKCVFVLWQAEFGRIVPLGKRKRFGLYWFRTGNFGGYLGNYSRL